MLSTRLGKASKRAIAVAALATTLTTIAACGGGSDSASGGASDGGGKVDEDAAAAASERLEPNLEEISDIGITTPLTSAPEAGKVAYLIRFNNSTSEPMEQPFKDAVGALGWESRVLATDAADPQGTSNAIKQAVAAGADYITINSTSVDAIGPGLDAAKAAGVPIVLNASVGEVEGEANGIYGNVANVDNIAASGLALMDWAIADSQGAGSVLFVTYPDIPILAASGAKVEAGFKENCPQCSLSIFKLSTPQVVNGDMVTGIVSEIRKNPEIKYVTMDISLAGVGLREALDAAGLTDVEIGVGYPTTDQFEGIRDGSYGIGAAYGNDDAVYAAVDQMARLDVGMDAAQDEHAVRPFQLYTEDNIGADVDYWAGPQGFKEQYLALWGKD
ncbi:sugar ABC transporter substrate-binding protein [Modestobacter versicolor]|uniref:sugar ABC transporter substrate-binding protein n=1 Tax=Modestobacter versicolor TaxID=429133 RepID=UPI0034DF902F